MATIKDLAKRKVVEKLIENTAKQSLKYNENLKDLSQDLYLGLLLRKEKVESMPDNEQIYYISRLAVNEIRSRHSRFYYRYIKPTLTRDSLDSLGLKELMDDNIFSTE